MKFFNPTSVFALLLPFLVSLVACSPAPAASLAARATVALERPQFPRVSLNLLNHYKQKVPSAPHFGLIQNKIQILKLTFFPH